MDLRTVFSSDKLRKFSLDRAYDSLPWVYACVQRIATAAAGVSPTFRPKEHSLVKRFLEPAFPLIPTWAKLLEGTFILLELDGGCLWWLDEDKLKLISIKQTIPLFDPNDQSTLLGWGIFRPGTLTIQEALTFREVIPFVYFNPQMPYRGLSPLHAARLSLEQWFNMAAWNAEFFETGIKSPLAIVYKNRLTPEQEKEIKRKLKEFYSGVKAGQSALIIDADAEVKPLLSSTKDLDFIDGQKLTREDICAVFGVPPAMVGIYEYANYANSREQRKIFWEQTMIPKLRLIEEMLNAYFSYVGVEVEFEFDLSKVDALRPDIMKAAQAAKLYFDLGYSKEEVAEILNMPVLAGGQETSGEALQEELEQSYTSPPVSKSLSDEDYASILRDYFVAFEAEVSRFYKALLHGTIEELLLQLRRLGELDYGLFIQNSELWHLEAEELSNKQTLFSFYITTKEIAYGLIKDFDRVEYKQFLPDSLLDTLDPVSYELAMAAAKEVAFKTKWTVDKTREALFDLVTAHLHKNNTIMEIRKDVYKILEEKYLGRSLTVARTISGTALNTGRYGAFQASGVTHHKWVTSRDLHVRPSHAAQHGVIREIGRTFPNGLLHPHDPTGSAGEVINCRCVTVPVKVQEPLGKPYGVKPTERPISPLKEETRAKAAEIVSKLAKGELAKSYRLKQFKGYVDEELFNLDELGAEVGKFAKLLKSPEMATIGKAIEDLRRRHKIKLEDPNHNLLSILRAEKYSISEEHREFLSEFLGRLLPKKVVDNLNSVRIARRQMRPSGAFVENYSAIILRYHSKTLEIASELAGYLLGYRTKEDLYSFIDNFVPEGLLRSIVIRDKLLTEAIDCLSTLTHELGHAIEDNVKWVAEIARMVWRERVRKRNKPYTSGFFPRLYAARVYPSGATESFSTFMNSAIFLPVNAHSGERWADILDDVLLLFYPQNAYEFWNRASQLPDYAVILFDDLKEVNE